MRIPLRLLPLPLLFVVLTATVVSAAAPPFVTLNPVASVTVLTGTDIAIPTNAVGSPAPTAQWQVSSNGGVTWFNLPFNTVPTLHLFVFPQDSGKQYRCVFSNASGSAVTTTMTLTVTLRVRSDIDDDRKSDLVVWRPSNGTWFWLNSRDGYNYASQGDQQWGETGDVPLSADMDGDGIMDFVVFRPGNGSPAFSTFFWITSSSGYLSGGTRQFGDSTYNDVPFAADIDGDGMADLAIWRPVASPAGPAGTWFWLSSNLGYTPGGSRQWGNASLGDQPLLGDFDGDGIADLTVWRASTGTWFWLTASSGYNTSTPGIKQWGNSSLGDIPLVGDMDGDGTSDLVLWRASTGTFFWLTSQSGFNYSAQGSKQWGSPTQGDIPMLGDLDGDGIADLVVWRPGIGTWFWLTSSTGYSYTSQASKQWGGSADIPMIK